VTVPRQCPHNHVLTFDRLQDHMMLHDWRSYRLSRRQFCASVGDDAAVPIRQGWCARPSYRFPTLRSADWLLVLFCRKICDVNKTRGRYFVEVISSMVAEITKPGSSNVLSFQSGEVRTARSIDISVLIQYPT
jgi:hypothetical protein